MKDTGQLQAGRESAGKTAGVKTERERAYLAAVARLYSDFASTPQRVRLIAYRDAREEVAAKYPEDHEAQIFYALAIAVSEHPSDKTYAGRLKAGAMLDRLFEEQPSHPGLAHYIIHTYDVPALANRALVAARRYSEIAPDAPHALHMPSHTFTRNGYWQESIDSNIAAAASARRRRPFRRIFCTGGDPGTVRARTKRLEASHATRAEGDTVSSGGLNDLVLPWIGSGATGAGASGDIPAPWPRAPNMAKPRSSAGPCYRDTQVRIGHAVRSRSH